MMKVRAVCWVYHNGWHRAGEVFETEDPSALTGLAVPVEEPQEAEAPTTEDRPKQNKRGRKA